MKGETRLFFVTCSDESNEELHETLELAERYVKRNFKNDHNPHIFIGIVKHSYYDHLSNGWNYEDRADTFELVKLLS